MKKILRGLLCIISMSILLAACGNQDESFRKIKWGMTLDEVITVEEKEGNSDYETWESSILDSDVLEYEGLVVNGRKASLSYYFKNETTGFDIIHEENFLPKKMLNEYDAILNSDLNEDELKEEGKKLYEKYRNEWDKYNEFLIENETVKFSDYILVEGEYSFKDLDEEDIQEIKKSLIKKYGEPTYGSEEDDFRFWNLDTIQLYYSEKIKDGKVSISYSANYKELEYKMRKNKSDSGGL